MHGVTGCWTQVYKTFEPQYERAMWRRGPLRVMVVMYLLYFYMTIQTRPDGCLICAPYHHSSFL
jgi:hypothetical protein